MILAGTLTAGGYATCSVLLAYMVAPVVQIATMSAQITEAVAGLSRTYEILDEKPEGHEPLPQPMLRQIDEIWLR